MPKKAVERALVEAIREERAADKTPEEIELQLKGIVARWPDGDPPPMPAIRTIRKYAEEFDHWDDDAK